MIKILLCGEGPTDYGKKDYNTKEWLDGPIHTLIRRTCNNALDIQCEEKQELAKVRLQRTKIKGHGIKAFKLAYLAEKGGINHAICYVDADKRDYDDIYNEIKEGFIAFGTDKVKGIPMIPLKMIECWLLSDEGAFKAVFGQAPINPKLPSKPETIWGEKDNPNSDYPKNVFDRVIKQYPNRDKVAEKHKAIAENTSIDVLRQKCAISFERFYCDIDSI